MTYVLCVMQKSVLQPLCWIFIGSAVLYYAYAAYVILCAIASLYAGSIMKSKCCCNSATDQAEKKPAFSRKSSLESALR